MSVIDSLNNLFYKIHDEVKIQFPEIKIDTNLSSIDNKFSGLVSFNNLIFNVNSIEKQQRKLSDIIFDIMDKLGILVIKTDFNTQMHIDDTCIMFKYVAFINIPYDNYNIKEEMIESSLLNLKNSDTYWIFI